MLLRGYYKTKSGKRVQLLEHWPRLHEWYGIVWENGGSYRTIWNEVGFNKEDPEWDLLEVEKLDANSNSSITESN